MRDNPRLLLAWIALLLVGLALVVGLADNTAEFAPDFLTEVVLSALLVADLTILLVFAFVLARNLIKVVVERRRALPFARFRAKLVGTMLGLTLIPASLVLLVGSELIRTSANRWFAAPVDDILASASRIAADYYHEREQAVRAQAGSLAQALAATNLARTNTSAVRDAVAPAVTSGQVTLVEVYRAAGRDGRLDAEPLFDVADSTVPRGYSRAASDRWAARALAGTTEPLPPEPLPGGGELVRWAEIIRPSAQAPPAGVVVVSDYLSGELALDSRRVVDAYEEYQQLRVLKGPLQGVYLSFFVMVTLLILVSATWMGLYLAKRITRPIQLLSEGAREIGAGHLDHRIERETVDEFGQLVDAFNAMANELAVSQRRLERSRHDLEQKNQESEGRRRYIETILERVATGVASLDAGGRLSTMNSAAARLLGLSPSALGQPVSQVFGREDLQPIRAVLAEDPRRAEPDGHEITLLRDGKETHLAVATTRVGGEGGFEGTVLVLDDVTPLIRAQKVAAWRDVARRLAHEIKNPLTPIQLSADRLRRHFSNAEPPVRAFVEECTSTIVTEVHSLKGLVDEFSQFARMPAPKTVPTDLNALIRDVLGLYTGLFPSVTMARAFAEPLPRVRVDAEQFKRVLVNLIDNALEALGGVTPDGTAVTMAGQITLETVHDATNHVVRVVVADDGPGFADADRSKLFMPYYSTKKRGSGLGLAIVRRIVAEHGGSIEASDNEPRGSRFTIELPC